MILKPLSEAEPLDEETTVAGAVLVAVFSPHLDGAEVTISNPSANSAVVGSVWVGQGLSLVEKHSTHEIAASANGVFGTSIAFR